MNRLRVALALDNTGSMASAGKIDALKTATKSLLDQLKAAAANNGDVYVSIIPFNKNVNVGTSTYTNANWVDWEDWEDDNGHDQSTTTCTTQKSGKNGKKKKKCSTTTTWVPDNHNTWNGCITDRDKNYDVTGTAPVVGTAATLFPAEQYDNCPVPVSGLSYDWNKHEFAREHHEGRWHDQPDHRPGVGLDVADRRRSVHGSGEGPELQVSGHHHPDERRPEHREPLGRQRLVAVRRTVDARMALACTNAKTAGLTVWTIHVNTDGDPTSQILKNCATDTNKFFTVTSSAQIGTVFTTIGSNLSQLRISK